MATTASSCTGLKKKSKNDSHLFNWYNRSCVQAFEFLRTLYQLDGEKLKGGGDYSGLDFKTFC